MAGEPWCFTPAQIAELTDWQIVELYVKPAEERAEEVRRERDGVGRGEFGRPILANPPDPPTPILPDRSEYVAFCVSELGWTRAHAEAEWDRQWGTR